MHSCSHFGCHVGSLFGASWAPPAHHVGLKTTKMDPCRPKTAHDAPKTPKEAAKTSQEAAKTAQDAPQDLPRAPKRSPRTHKTTPNHPKMASQSLFIILSCLLSSPLPSAFPLLCALPPFLFSLPFCLLSFSLLSLSLSLFLSLFCLFSSHPLLLNCGGELTYWALLGRSWNDL